MNQQKQILVIDDDTDLTEALLIGLESTGDYKVAIENDSRNGASSARETKPDAIILDVIMPGMDGGDVLAQFQQDSYLQRIPVILLTALANRDENHIGQVMWNGQHPMLAKPVELEFLIHCIEDAIAGKLVAS